MNIDSQIELIQKQTVLSDNLSLFDVLQKLKDQVREMSSKVSQLDQYSSLIANPAKPSTYLEVLKVKRNIINDITHLLQETKPLGKLFIVFCF